MVLTVFRGFNRYSNDLKEEKEKKLIINTENT